MSDSAAACQFDASPEEALTALRGHSGLMLIDLDETLYLRNSTEDFLDCARPAWMVVLVLRILDACRPWMLTGRDTRDNWRVAVVSTMFPWIWWRWKARVRLLADRHANVELAAALRSRDEPFVILTAGFRSIVTPLLHAMGFGNETILAARTFALADRREGKLRMAARELGTGAVADSLVLTDSMADDELMRACGTALRTRWPTARYVRAHSRIYIPGEYVSRIKHPGERYILRAILQDDFAFWILSSIGLAANWSVHVAGLLFLLVSFWCIYERGYVDNDAVASSFEEYPKLTSAFGEGQFSVSLVQPWIWALVSGAIGIAILNPETSAFLRFAGVWVVVLLLVHFTFRIYNRLDKQTRLWVYPLLQMSRAASFATIVAIEPVGVAALSAHAFARWVPYASYRFARSTDWPKVPTALFRLIGFVLISLILAASVGWHTLSTWSALAILLWNVIRARHELRSALRSCHRIDRKAPENAEV